jgi:hypothetical protein
VVALLACLVVVLLLLALLLILVLLSVFFLAEHLALGLVTSFPIAGT